MACGDFRVGEGVGAEGCKGGNSRDCFKRGGSNGQLRRSVRTLNGLCGIPEAVVQWRREIERCGPMHGYFGHTSRSEVGTGSDGN